LSPVVLPFLLLLLPLLLLLLFCHHCLLIVVEMVIVACDLSAYSLYIKAAGKALLVQAY
jgi:hypothetical protein